MSLFSTVFISNFGILEFGNNIFVTPIIIAISISSFFVILSFIKKGLLKISLILLFIANLFLFIYTKNINYFLIGLLVGAFIFVVLLFILYIYEHKFELFISANIGKKENLSSDSENNTPELNNGSLNNIVGIEQKKQQKKNYLKKQVDKNKKYEQIKEKTYNLYYGILENIRYIINSNLIRNSFIVGFGRIVFLEFQLLSIIAITTNIYLIYNIVLYFSSNHKIYFVIGGG